MKREDSRAARPTAHGQTRFKTASPRFAFEVATLFGVLLPACVGEKLVCDSIPRQVARTAGARAAPPSSPLVSRLARSRRFAVVAGSCSDGSVSYRCIIERDHAGPHDLSNFVTFSGDDDYVALIRLEDGVVDGYPTIKSHADVGRGLDPGADLLRDAFRRLAS